MDFKRWINQARRKALRAVTSGIGKSDSSHADGTINVSEIKRILVVRPNGRLGNQLLMTPFVQELIATFPTAQIDLFVKGGVSSVIFSNYPQVEEIIKLPGKPFKELKRYFGIWRRVRKGRYDMVANVAGTSSSGRIATRFSHADIRFFSSGEPATELPLRDHIAVRPVYNLREFLKRHGISSSEPIPTLSIKLSGEETHNGRKVLGELTGSDKPVIGIYTFATGDKCYDGEWWNPFYDKLVERYGNQYSILEVLPIENVSQIDFRATSYYSRDIREMTAVIGAMSLFITADCGIMHLASAAGVPVLGMFSVTDPKIYLPYNKGSIAINTNEIKDHGQLLTIIDSMLANS